MEEVVPMNRIHGILADVKLRRPSQKTVFFLCGATAIILFIAALLACITMFIYADRNSSDSRLLNRAVTETTSIAETLKAANGNMDAAGQLMSGHQLYDATDSTLTFYYDDDLRPAAQTNSPYRAVAEKSTADFCYQYDITVQSSETGQEIYHLTFKTPVRGGGRQ